MTTIQFEGGQKVNFDGNPTPQDVDFVAQQIGVGKTAPPTPAPQSIFSKYVGQPMANAFNSGVNQIKTGFQQAQLGNDPVTALRGALNIGGGAVNATVGALTAPVLNPTLGAGINYMADKTSNSPTLQRFAMSPAGQNVATGAEMLGNTSAIAGAVAGGAEAEPGVTSAVETGAGKVADLAQGAKDAVGNAGESTAGGIMNRVARLTPTDAKTFEKMTGMTQGEYLTKTGNFGDPYKIINNELDKFTSSKNAVDTALNALPGQYSSAPIKTMAAELYNRELRVSSEGAPSPDLANASTFVNKLNNDGGLTMSDINALKRTYERTVKLGYMKDLNTEGVEKATNLDSAVRSWQFQKADDLGLKNLPEMNKQTQASKFLIDKLGKQLVGQNGNNAISITDWITLAGKDPALFAAKKIFGSKVVQARFAKLIAPDATAPITPQFGGAKGFMLNAPELGADKFSPLPMNAPTPPTTYEPPARSIFNQNQVPPSLNAPGQNPILLGPRKPGT